MHDQDAFKEAVFLFDGNEISSEMHYGEFEALLNRAAPVSAHAATVVRGVYAVIGTGLAVRGVVCFLLKFDRNGYADADFSVPLRHLVRNAGPGPDVGCGVVRMASRGQCPVTWHATNLWEPLADGGEHPVKRVQDAVWRNRLGIHIPADVPAIAAPAAPRTQASARPASGAVDVPEPAKAAAAPAPEKRIAPPAPEKRAAAPAREREREREKGASPPAPTQHSRTARNPLEDKLEQTFGGDSRLSAQQLMLQHNRQIEALTRKYRLEVEQQQQIYLNQIRNVREEMRRVKSQLRHEQSRNQRLQQLLRGEVGS